MPVVDAIALAAAIAKGLPAVIELLEQAGCALTNCEAAVQLMKDAAPDEARDYRDARHELASEAAGISKR